MTGAGHYQPEVDGLRAVAVVAVVAFHVGLPGISGGFAGVDVFYVISGYLITSLLAGELARTGSIDLVAFYARRVRRLLPALCLVVVATLAFGFFWLHPFGELQELARSAIATALFSSNFFFWSTSDGYFDPPPYARPLLHTWSLAVEEQFYLLWPLLLLLLYRLARHGRRPYAEQALGGIAAVFAASLTLNLLLTPQHPGAAFYLLPARAWELALGALVALSPRQMLSRRPRLGAAAGLLGLAGIATSALWFDTGSPWPGVRSVLPAAAAACVIAGSGVSSSLAGRLLSARPVVYVGRLSYSWYLWHWPLLSITRAHRLGEVSLPLMAAVGGLSLALAAATYHAVENPIRRRRPGPFRAPSHALVSGAALLLAIIAAAGTAGLWARAAAARPEAGAFSSARRLPALPRPCRQDEPFGALTPAAQCTLGESGAPIKLVLWGDSHADQFGPMLAAFGREQHARVLERLFVACPPLLDYDSAVLQWREAACVRFNQAVHSELAALRAGGLNGVVLSARWLSYAGIPELSLEDEPHNASDFRGVDRAAEYLRVQHALAHTVAAIRALGLRVLILGPVPEMRFDIPDCLVRNTMNPAVCDVARALVDEHRQGFVRDLGVMIEGVPGTRLWDPITEFCDTVRCYARRADAILFRDDDHISVAAAEAAYASAASTLSWAAGSE